MYSSPEVIIGGKQSFEDDIWALGVIFFELIYGINPFFGAQNK